MNSTNDNMNCLLRYYIAIHLGQIPMDLNELVAATEAAKLHAEDHAGTHIATDANWALPVVHLLNMHMREENLPPIAFKTTAAMEDEGPDRASKDDVTSRP